MCERACEKSCSTKSIAVTRWVCLNGSVSLCLGMALFCVWCLASIQFAYSVQVSDACSNSEDSVLQVVNNSLAYSSQHDQAVTTYQIVNYYLYCDDAHSYNPLIFDMTEAQAGMSLINSSVLWYYYNGSSYGVPQVFYIYIHTYIRIHICVSLLCVMFTLVVRVVHVISQNESTQLLMDYQQFMKQSTNELLCLQCSSLNGLYHHTRNDLCLTFVKQWYITYVCEFALVFFVAIRGCFLCKNKASVQSEPKTVLTEDDIKPNFGRVDPSPEPTPPSFEASDDDVKKALRYLYKCETLQERKDKANQLKAKGYPDSNKSVSKNAVDKAVSILNNRDRTSKSTYIHPFLQEILDTE
ncbi:hypothetical protein RFI_05757 [Reticulomyxa filosa]|uniref:Uncharacterized protein n=1 Tax=Reticulomyxa filosa TaxID=46433 RepID=X6NZI9_RETFI|nr:hypothetical protein RFI_05757 [Reticulomyxa filosa]|eukprot:ETO31361.1 hypothetical protein RFI_05757 [Reticulomyxa filosa]